MRAGPDSSPGLAAVPWLLGAVAIGVQIVWVLLPQQCRDAATLASVLATFLASTSHAAIHRGLRWCGEYVAITAGLGFVVEALGTATGVPFGAYSYGDRLGPMLAGVPLLIPLAWSMICYPILLMARTLASRRWVIILLGAWTLAAWDLFLDPQMVAEGHWTFRFPTPALPGAPGIPLTNYAGWFLTGLVLFWLLQLLPDHRADDRLPAALLLWTYASNVLAAAVFFGRPAVALIGGSAMGVTVIPWAVRVLPGWRSGALHAPRPEPVDRA